VLAVVCYGFCYGRQAVMDSAGNRIFPHFQITDGLWKPCWYSRGRRLQESDDGYYLGIHAAVPFMHMQRLCSPFFW
jgi:hypothetical protein